MASMKGTLKRALALAVVIGPHGLVASAAQSDFERSPLAAQCDVRRPDCQQFVAEHELRNAALAGNTAEVQHWLPLVKNLREFMLRFVHEPLRNALVRGEPQVAEALMRHGADPLMRNRDGKPLLFEVIAQIGQQPARVSPQQLAALRIVLAQARRDKLLDDSPMDAQLAFGGTQQPELLALLMEFGADPQRKAQFSNGALARAIHDNQTELLRVLLRAKPSQAPAQLDAWAYEKFIAGRDDMVSVLREAGADPARHARSNPKALFDAVRREGTVAQLEFVLKSGADPNARENAAMPPALVLALGDIAKLRLLLQHGADANAKDPGGMTVLSHAVSRSRMHTPDAAADAADRTAVQLLLDRGAQVNGDLGGFAFAGALAATRRDDHAMIDLLLQRGATLQSTRRLIAPGIPSPETGGPPPGPVTVAMDLERDDLALAILNRDKRVAPGDADALSRANRKGWTQVAAALKAAGAQDAAPAQAASKRPAPDPRTAAGFAAMVADVIDGAARLDPPGFQLSPQRGDEPVRFHFYGSADGSARPAGFKSISCDRAVAYQFYLRANLLGGIAVGECTASSAAQARDLAIAARSAHATLFEQLRGGGVMTDSASLERMGWAYRASKQADGNTVYAFPVVAVGHGLVAASTVVRVSADARRAWIVQAELGSLCNNNQLTTPLCTQPAATLEQIAQEVGARLQERR